MLEKNCMGTSPRRNHLLVTTRQTNPCPTMPNSLTPSLLVLDSEWRAITYHLLHRNCNHFSEADPLPHAGCFICPYQFLEFKN